MNLGFGVGLNNYAKGSSKCPETQSILCGIGSEKNKIIKPKTLGIVETLKQGAQDSV